MDPQVPFVVGKVFALLGCVLLQTTRAQIHSVPEGVSLEGGYPAQGTVQLAYSGRSGLLCADGLTRATLRVVCRDLGLPEQFPSLQTVAGAQGVEFVGTGLSCQGSEVKVADCAHDEWGLGKCASGDAAYLACKSDPCQPSPCENGGACVTEQTEVGFRCDCPSTWSGLLCTTDVNECSNANAGCSDLCVNTDGGYGCECPANELELGPDNHTCSAVGESVVCGTDFMELTFEKQHFQSLHREHLTLSDPSCTATDNATHIILRAPLSACGTQSQLVGTTLVYKNVVRSREETVGGMISRVKEVEVPFQCVMSLQESVALPLTVDTQELHFLVEASGQHSVGFQFSPDGQFGEGRGSVSVYPGQKIWARANLNTSDPDLTVAIGNCIASPYNSSASRNDSSAASSSGTGSGGSYTVLSNGCPADSTLVLLNATDVREREFMLEAFKFLDNSPEVVYHCDLELCDSKDLASLCSQGCVAST